MKVLVATAIYPTAENPAYGAFVRAQVEGLERAGIEIELLRVDGRYGKLKYPRSILELPRHLADGSVDLIHAHYSYPGAVARTQFKVPVVVTFHGDDLQGTRNQQGRLEFGSRVIAAGGVLLAHLVDACIVQNKYMAERIQGTNVHLIPCEINLETFRPIDRNQARSILGLDPGKRYVLFAANPEIPVKNFPFARATADYLTQRDPSVELVIIYKETQERLALYLNACDALIFPSFQEGSPVVVKQAMACNLPIVASDVGDVREVIGATDGCYICNLDITQFADRLSEVLQRGARTNGRENVRHLASPVVAQKIIGVYEQVLAGRRSARKEMQPSRKVGE